MESKQVSKEAVVNTVIKRASKGEFSTFSDLQDHLNGFRVPSSLASAKNEFLKDINNVLAKIVITDLLGTKVPFIDWFWKSGENSPYGDYKELRQILLGRVGEYSEYMDVNDHFKPETLTVNVETVFRDQYTVSISTNIIKAAFNGPGDFAKYIAQYMASMEHSFNLKWLDRSLEMFDHIPLVYKLQSDITNGVEVAKELWYLIERMKQVSTNFNYAGIPNVANAEDLKMVVRPSLNKNIQFDSVGGVYNFGNISNSSKIASVLNYDFKSTDTLGVIVTDFTFWLDERFAEQTQQEWAKTLIEDRYFTHFVRGAFIPFATGIRIVTKDSAIKDGDAFVIKPFGHECNIMDITDKVTKGGVYDGTNILPVDARSFCPNGLPIEMAGDVPTEAEVMKALTDFNRLKSFDPSRLKFIKVINNKVVMQAIAPYVVNSFTDEFEFKYTKKSTKNTK